MWDSVHTEARFTLLPYRAAASRAKMAAESAAAKQLLDCFAQLAKPG
jgi:hypothetical protein